MNLAQLLSQSEDEARTMLETIRWPDGPVCPHCQSQKGTRLAGEAARPGTIQCNDCRKQYTVTVGTVMHRSRIPLKKWIAAFHMMCSSKKGVSALQVQRQLGFGSYKTAWHLCHRIRLAMTQEPLVTVLKGDVEMDETYIGGKRRNMSKSKRAELGRNPRDGKVAVLALVERDGNLRTTPVEFVDGETVRGVLEDWVDPESRVITDSARVYTRVGEMFTGGHESVNHKADEWVRGDVHTNTVESFFGLLKRGIVGSFHKVSKKHLWRYCDEFSFRWNHRKDSDGERTLAAIRAAGGKRLLYFEPVMA